MRHNGYRVLIFLLLTWGATTFAKDMASQLFSRLAGVPLSLWDSRRPQIDSLLQQGKYLEAARIATDDDNFYNVTIRQWAAPMSDRNEDPLAILNDFIAMVVGTVRDDRDFREILTGDFTYVGPPKIGDVAIFVQAPGNNLHYQQLETNWANLRRVLVRKEPQQSDITDAAGVLTSRAWGLSHLDAGTNRRAIEYAFREFLCTSISELRDLSLTDSRVRRDVDRKPGGDSRTYLNTCKGCHSGLDALVGAYAYFQFGNQVIQEIKVQKKMNQNGDVYPEGHITTDHSWTNLWTQNQNATLGWRGPRTGQGVRAFGYMLSNSQAFAKCMARRAFQSLCLKEIEPADENHLAELGTKFENHGYSLRRLFEETAILPACLSR